MNKYEVLTIVLSQSVRQLVCFYLKFSNYEMNQVPLPKVFECHDNSRILHEAQSIIKRGLTNALYKCIRPAHMYTGYFDLILQQNL